MKAIALLALLGLFGSAVAEARTLERELGDFSLKLGTAPARSMAQGLINPSPYGSLHGGFDLTHESGWYVGHWSPSMGVRDNTLLELDSYVGFFRPLDERLGYELGVIRYSVPETNFERHQYYAGMTLLGSRLGAAVNQAPARTDSTLLLDLGLDVPWRMDMTLKYSTHNLNFPVMLSDGRRVSSFDDWSLNFSRPWLGSRFDLSYTGSSLGGSGCAAYSGPNRYCQDYWSVRWERPLF